jgi:hypothetical protein
MKTVSGASRIALAVVRANVEQQIDCQVCIGKLLHLLAVVNRSRGLQ